MNDEHQAEQTLPHPDLDVLQVVEVEGVFVVTGDIDMAGGPVLERSVRAADHGPLILDLGGVAFIDSSGLRTLLALSRSAAEAGHVVTLRSVGPEVLRLLEITGTTGQFDIGIRAQQ